MQSVSTRYVKGHQNEKVETGDSEGLAKGTSAPGASKIGNAGGEDVCGDFLSGISAYETNT